MAVPDDGDETEALSGVLAAVVEKDAAFELETTEIGNDGTRLRPARQHASATELREIYRREKGRTVDLRVIASVPDESMSRLEDALRRTLERFIDPDADRIGHAFPIAGGSGGETRTTQRADGLRDEEFRSPVRDFVSALVRAAALIGAETAAGLLDEWKRGAALRFHMCTVVNGLPLAASASPREDIRLVPLPLATADLPRLPVRRDAGPRDYLGLALLTLRVHAAPALFRPEPDDRQEQTVRCGSVDDVNLDVVCESLSLQSGLHVSKSFIWHDYGDAEAFRLGSSESWPEGGDRLRPMRPKHVSISYRTGVETITPADDEAPRDVDEAELGGIIESVPRADRKLRIAVDRWRRSTLPGARLEDRFIDLRVALEALYLKDFANEHSQEMRFRLALMGAWHLSASVEERRTVRKALRDAYDRASGAVHTGEVPRAAEAELLEAQSLCRRGILKLLGEGAPADWGDMMLGAEDAPGSGV